MGQPKTIAAALGTLAGGTLIDADPQASLAIWGDRRQLPHPVILELALSRVATRLAQIHTPVVISAHSDRDWTSSASPVTPPAWVAVGDRLQAGQMIALRPRQATLQTRLAQLQFELSQLPAIPSSQP